ncbi:MAG: hypothetical protein IJ109_09795 [Firmicutes bacterium]|nr:hypothetical protein [Bacillota bacterium]
MKRTIDYIISDPEGNTTILVLSQTERRDYPQVAKLLLAKHPQAEQVGFIKTDAGGNPVSMEMCGLEFCGNATRSFGFYRSMLSDPPARELDLKVSGCDHPLKGWIDPPKPGEKDEEGYLCGRVRVEMPVPTDIETVRIPVSEEFGSLAEQLTGGCLEGRIVHMDGISHLVIPGVSDSMIRQEGQERIGELFCFIRDYIYETNERDMPAFGVMFVDEAADRMNPIVYVRDVDTIYFEGSCASGSAAAACAAAAEDIAAGRKGKPLAGQRPRACMYSYRFRQPAGTLSSEVTADSGAITGLQLYGGVRQSDVMRTETEGSE